MTSVKSTSLASKAIPNFSMIAGALNTKKQRDGGWPRMASTSPSSSGVGIGTLRLIGTRVKQGSQQSNQPLRSPAAYALPTIKRVRIVRRADGYFCQFCLAVCRVKAHEDTGVERGIDVGLNSYYTDSEGQKVENPRFFRKAERKVAQLQRQVSRPERAAQAAQKAESLTQVQHLSQRAARGKAPTSTAPTLAHPPQDR